MAQSREEKDVPHVPPALQGVSFFELWQPTLLVESLLLQALYLFLVTGPWKHRFRGYQPVSSRTIILFLCGLWVLYLAFGTPIDYVSDHMLFSVHMVQHMIEIVVLVPLLVAGTPGWLIRPLLSRPLAARIWRFLTHPIAGVALFNLVFFGFHLPALYNLTLVSESFHFFEHACFFVAALFFWWPILSPLPEFPRLAPGPRMLYVFYASGLMMPVEVFLILQQHVLYHYHAAAVRMFGISPLTDQQLGFTIMFFGMAIPYAAIALSAYVKYDNRVWYE